MARQYIHDIIESRDINILKKLLEKGENPDSLNSIEGDMGGVTPLFFANSEQAELLIQYGANVNHLDSLKENALFYLMGLDKEENSNTEKIKKIKLLLKHGINIHQKNINQENFIFNWNLNYDFEMLYFLEKIGVDFKCLNDNREHFLFHISDKTDTKIIKYLLDKGLDINQENKDKETLIFSTENTFLLQFYIDNGLDINKQNIRGDTILTSTNSYNVMKFCINNYIDINIINKEGLNSLDNCLYYSDIVKILLDKDINILQNIEFYKTYQSFHLVEQKIKENLANEEKDKIYNKINKKDNLYLKKRI